MYRFITILYFISTTTFALDCENAISTPDLNACAKQEQEKTELELNAVYKEVIEAIADKYEDQELAEINSAFVEAQRIWIKFREADCKAVYIKNQGGTMRTVMRIGCMQARAKQRIKELKSFDEAY